MVPNWNGGSSISQCLRSLIAQVSPANIIVVDNGSTDNSVRLIKKEFPGVGIVVKKRNLGFAGGVNAGIRQAIKYNADYIAIFNNDAVADTRWIEQLVNTLANNQHIGIACSKMISTNQELLDSTGEFYTSWGLPYPRGRGEPVSDKYDQETPVFGASGGASLYRVEMLKEIGLFDEDFFAYYEDVDLSFRAQLAGWKVAYVPSAIAYHQIGATSSKIKGFTTYQTLKNLPMVVRRNVPLGLLPTVLPRFWLAYTTFFWSAVARGEVWPALKGWVMAMFYLPKNMFERRQIQKTRKVPVDYIKSMLVHDLPPSATRLRALRANWWKLRRKHG